MGFSWTGPVRQVVAVVGPIGSTGVSGGRQMVAGVGLVVEIVGQVSLGQVTTCHSKDSASSGAGGYSSCSHAHDECPSSAGPSHPPSSPLTSPRILGRLLSD